METKKVLIVEDYPDDVMLIERVFRQLPVKIESTLIDDAREAVYRSSEWTPLKNFFDLVLLDSRLPGGTGQQILHALRESDPDGLVPIILLIGASGDDFSETALMEGADACVVKPLSPEAFMAKVHLIADTWLLSLADDER